MRIQLLDFCTEAHPGWDNLSGNRDAELRKNAPATGVISSDEGSGAGGPLRARHIRTSAGVPAPRMSVKEREVWVAHFTFFPKNVVDRFSCAHAHETPAQRFVRACRACAPHVRSFGNQTTRAVIDVAIATQRVS